MSSADRRVPRINGLKLFEIAQRARDAAFSLIAGPGFASFGPGSRIMLPFRAGNPQKVAIGSQVLIGPSSWFMVPRLDAPGAVIHIGDRVRMNQTSISAVRARDHRRGRRPRARRVHLGPHARLRRPTTRDPRSAARADRTGAHRPRCVARPERGRPARRHDRGRRRHRRQQRRDARRAGAHVSRRARRRRCSGRSTHERLTPPGRARPRVHLLVRDVRRRGAAWHDAAAGPHPADAHVESARGPPPRRESVSLVRERGGTPLRGRDDGVVARRTRSGWSSRCGSARADATSRRRLVATYRRYDECLRRGRRARWGCTRRWSSPPTPWSPAFAPLAWASTVTYFARDDWLSSPARRAYWPAYREPHTARSASPRSGVVAVSQQIIDRIDPRGPHAVVPNGVEPARVGGPVPAGPGWLAAIPGPRAIYVGTIDSRLDTEGVAALAPRRPDLQHRPARTGARSALHPAAARHPERARPPGSRAGRARRGAAQR